MGMLSKLEVTRTRIVSLLKAGKSHDDVMKIMDVSKNQITGALNWAERAGIFDKDRVVLLEQRILETVRDLERLEELAKREYDRLLKVYKRNDEVEKDLEDAESRGLSARDRSFLHRLLSTPDMSKTIVPLMKEIRESRVLLMELQGLYKQQVNVLVNNVQNNLIVLPGRLKHDEWAMAVAEALKVDVDSAT